MKFVRKHWILSGVLLGSLLCYIGALISPQVFWPSVFLCYAIPVVLVFNIVLLPALFFLKKRSSMLFPAIAILAGLPFILVTWRYTNPRPGNGVTISVLSYNAKLFRTAETYSKFSQQQINWVSNDTSAIKCIQEFSTNDRWKELNIKKRISDKGYYAYTFKSRGPNNDHNRGMAIFTRYPVIDSGVVWDDPTYTNAIIFVDVKVNDKPLRIYNVHLASMNLGLAKYKDPSDYGEKIRMLLYKLKQGGTKRTDEVDKLIAHAKTSPYPFLICGDFNELPYGYNYRKLRSKFQGSFEEAGKGFGFSLHSKLFFIRIDHHFHSDHIRAMKFLVDRSNTISDHFPTRAIYKFD